MYRQLGLSSDGDALAHHVVPVRHIQDTNGKQGVVMPAFQCSLDTPPYLNIEAIIAGVKEITTAIKLLHSKGVTHNDIKPGNILLDSSGRWFLCDYGSCSHDGYDKEFNVCFTPAYVPFGMKLKPSEKLDFILIAMTALVKLEGSPFSNMRERLSIRTVLSAIDDIENFELKSLLTALVDDIASV